MLATLVSTLGLGARAGAQVPPGVSVEHAAPFAPRPNILLIIADDLGVDRVGVYAEHPDPGHTPVVDGLAAAGVLFRNAWSNPTCSPTRATLLTGRYAFRTGIGRAIAFSGDFELAPRLPSLPRLLRGGFAAWNPSPAAPGAAGAPAPRVARYHTAAVGKWHLATDSGSGWVHPLLFDFDEHRGPIENLPDGLDSYFDYEKIVDGVATNATTYATTDQVDDALDIITTTPDPWFVWLAFSAPHGPFHKPPAGLHTFDLPPLVNDDIPAHHKAMTEAMDTEIGRLLAGIPAAQLARTYVVFVGDNGTPKGATTAPFPSDHAKSTPFEGGINVPLIIAGPGVTPGAECVALVNTTDLFATIVEWAGVDGGAAAPSAAVSPDAISPDAVSLVPYLDQPDQPSLRPWVYAESLAPNGPPPWVAHTRIIREARYKLIDQQLSGGGTLTRLYDLHLDPFEQQDLLARGRLEASAQTAFDTLTTVLAGLR